MAINIGLATKQYYHVDSIGCQYPRGRVAAFSKAIHLHDVTINEMFKSLLKNTVMWSRVNRGRNKIAYFDTEDDEFNTALQALLQSIPGSVVIKLLPWYEEILNNNDETIGCYVLFPNYNPSSGSHMPDLTQNKIRIDVLSNSCGLVIGEWFHYLHSIDIDTKRSFAYHGDGTLSTQPTKDEKHGLFELSPFDFGTYLNIVTPNRLKYVKIKDNDSITRNISSSFYANIKCGETCYRTVGYDSIITRLENILPSQEPDEDLIDTGTPQDIYTTDKFYYLDIYDEVVATTTTTTTTLPPDKQIKMHVADLKLINNCGPYKITLTGEHKDYFLIEDNKLYLTQSNNTPIEYRAKILVEDFFTPKRFKDFIKEYRIKLNRCDAFISLPLNGADPAYSYRIAGNRWGPDDTSNQIITNYEEHSFSGEGTYEDPVEVCIGGQHGDKNVFWMQVNVGGSLYAELTPSTESWSEQDRYCKDKATNQSVTTFSDWGSLYLVSGVDPSQHTSDIGSLKNNLSIPDANFIPLLGSAVAAGNKTVSTSHSITLPPEFENVNTYLLLTYSKDDQISINDDNICAKIFIGTTPPPEPKLSSLTVVFVNSAENSKLNNPDTTNGDRKTVTITGVFGEEATADDYNKTQASVSILNPSTYRFTSSSIEKKPTDFTEGSFNVSHSASLITARLTNYTFGLRNKTIFVYIDGERELIPTTTEAPLETYKVNFINQSYNVAFNIGLSNAGTVLPGDTLTAYWQARPTPDNTGGITYFITYACDTNGCTSTFYRNRNLPLIEVVNTAGNESTCPDDKQSYTPPSSSDVYEYCTSFNTSINEEYYSFSMCDCPLGNCNCSNLTYTGALRMPEGGNEIDVILKGVALPPTTTLPPTTQPPPLPPCDGLILVRCRQNLDCVYQSSTNTCEPRLSTSTNNVEFYTCCEGVTESDIISRVYNLRIGGNAATNEDRKAEIDLYYADKCPAVPDRAFDDCSSPVDGDCDDNIIDETIDAVTCFSSDQLLP